MLLTTNATREETHTWLACHGNCVLIVTTEPNVLLTTAHSVSARAAVELLDIGHSTAEVWGVVLERKDAS